MYMYDFQFEHESPASDSTRIVYNPLLQQLELLLVASLSSICNKQAVTTQ